MRLIYLTTLIGIVTYITTLIIGINFVSVNINCSYYLSNNYGCKHFLPAEITITNHIGFNATGNYNNISCNFENDIGYARPGDKINGFYQVENPHICSSRWSEALAKHSINTEKLNYYVIVFLISLLLFPIPMALIICYFEKEGYKPDDEVNFHENFANFQKLEEGKLCKDD